MFAVSSIWSTSRKRERLVTQILAAGLILASRATLAAGAWNPPEEPAAEEVSLPEASASSPVSSSNDPFYFPGPSPSPTDECVEPVMPVCGEGEIAVPDVSNFPEEELGECAQSCNFEDPEYCSPTPTASPSPSYSPSGYEWQNDLIQVEVRNFAAGEDTGLFEFDEGGSCVQVSASPTPSLIPDLGSVVTGAPVAELRHEPLILIPAEKGTPLSPGRGGFLPQYPNCAACGQVEDLYREKILPDGKSLREKIPKCEECVRVKQKRGRCFLGWICKRTSKSCDLRQKLCDDHSSKVRGCLASKKGTILSNGFDMTEMLVCLKDIELGCNCTEKNLAKTGKAGARGPFQITPDTWTTCLQRPGALSDDCKRPITPGNDPRIDTCCAAQCAAELITETPAEGPGINRWGSNNPGHCMGNPAPIINGAQ